MEITIDDESGAVYVQHRSTEVVTTVERSEGVNVDFDADGLVVGVEWLNTAEGSIEISTLTGHKVVISAP